MIELHCHFCQLRFKFLKSLSSIHHLRKLQPLGQQILVVQGIRMFCNLSPPWRPKAKRGLQGNFPNSKYSCRWKYDIKSYQIISNHTRNNITIISWMFLSDLSAFENNETRKFDSIGTRTRKLSNGKP